VSSVWNITYLYWSFKVLDPISEVCNHGEGQLLGPAIYLGRSVFIRLKLDEPKKVIASSI